MNARQLQLFASPRPLEQRLGKAFFEGIPSGPGVYIMTGAGERVLYIGQSSNLRARLGTYKNAQPDRAPRKVIRLIHEVRSIAWERCGTAAAAVARESELLLLHRPKFNRAGTFPRKVEFLYLKCDEFGCELGRSLNLPDESEGFGPIKGAVVVHAALARCLWFALRKPASCFEFPAGLMHWRVPPRQRIPWLRPRSETEAAVLDQVRSFLRGEANELLSNLRQTVEAAWAGDRSLSQFLESDLEVLEQFQQRR